MPLLLSHHQELLLLLLLVAVSASDGDSSGDTYDTSMCLSEPFICGNVSLSYPFYLSGETKDLKGYSNSYCGYPGMGIVCDDGNPILQTESGENCRVMSIEGTSANVSLADPDVVEGSCPKVDHNVTFGQGSWLDFPANTVDYLAFFLNCDFGPLVQPPTSSLIICPDFANYYPGHFSFVFPDDSVPPGNWQQKCEPVIKVPVLKYPRVEPNDTAWGNTSYAEVLRQGFQASWDSNRPGQCTQCEDSNGRCAFNQTGGFLGCACTNGRINGTICGTYNSTGDGGDGRRP